MHTCLFTKDIWLVTVRLDDDHPGTLDDRPMPEIGRAQVEIPVLVNRTCLEDDDVHRVDEAPIVVRDLAEIDRKIVAAPGIVLLPVVAGIVQAERIHVTPVRIGFEHGTRAHRQAAANLDVGQLMNAGSKDIRLTEACAVVEPHAGGDEPGGTLSGNRLRLDGSDPHRHLSRIILTAGAEASGPNLLHSSTSCGSRTAFTGLDLLLERRRRSL